MRLSDNRDTEEVSIGFAEWLWPVPNDIKALYFVLASVLIIIVLAWRGWYEFFVVENQKGLAGVAIEVIGFAPAAGFFSMFVMSVLMAGGMTMFGKSMHRQGVILGEARGKVIGRSEGLSESAAWYQRKMEADARGEPFDEPPPWERNGRNPTNHDDTANS